MFSDPVQIIENLPLLAGSHIADLGAGTGAYSIVLAQRVNAQAGGKVFAVEVQKDLLDTIEKEAKEKKLTTITPVWGDAERSGGTRLRDGSIDIVVIANTLFQIDDKQGIATEAARIAKDGGVLLVVDWTDSFEGMGPHKDAVYTKEQAVELFGTHGFDIDREIDAGEHHYGIIMKKHTNYEK